MRLNKYRKSDINHIIVFYGVEKVEFNLWDEVNITEEIIDTELMKQASKYGFLLLLQKKLNTQFEQLRQRRKQAYARLVLRAKGRRGVNGRYLSIDDADAWVRARKSFIQLTDKCIKAKDSADAIYAAVSAFMQRKDLLQTISSNLRKEK